VLTARPEPGTWSAIEYAAHSRDITGALGYLAHLALSHDHPQPAGPAPATPEPEVPATIAAAITELDKNVARLNAKCSAIGADDWARPITLAADTADVSRL